MRFANNAREIAVKRVFQIVLVYINFRDDFVDVLIKNPFSSGFFPINDPDANPAGSSPAAPRR